MACLAPSGNPACLELWTLIARNAGQVTQPGAHLPADDIGLFDLEAVVADSAEAVVEGLDLDPALVGRPPAAQPESDVGPLVGRTRTLVGAEMGDHWRCGSRE